VIFLDTAITVAFILAAIHTLRVYAAMVKAESPEQRQFLMQYALLAILPTAWVLAAGLALYQEFKQ
jgi:hypothetical protein